MAVCFCWQPWHIIGSYRKMQTTEHTINLSPCRQHQHFTNQCVIPDVCTRWSQTSAECLLSSCSLMLPLSSPSQRQLREFLSSRPPAFSYSVSILDLDPKPFDSIPRQLRLDQKIVSCYLRTGGTLPKGSLPPLPAIFTAAEREDCTLLFHPVWTPWRLTPCWCPKQRRDAMWLQV